MHQKKTAPDKKFFTPGEAHEIIGHDVICRLTIYRAIKRNEIPHVKLGTRILIPAKPFLEWLSGKRA